MSETRLRQGLLAEARSLGKKTEKGGEKERRDRERQGRKAGGRTLVWIAGKRRKTQRHDRMVMSGDSAGRGPGARWLTGGARKTRLDGLRMWAGRRFGKGKCRLEIGSREARARKERECRGGRAASAGVMRESHCRRCLPHPLPPAGEKCSGSAGTGEGRNRHGRNSALLRAESSHGPARWERQIFSAECGLACLLNASTWPAAISSFLLWA